MRNVIKIAVSLMVVALIIPLAIGLVTIAGDYIITVNGTAYQLKEVADPSVITLLTVLLPVIAIIGIVLFFVPKGKS